MLFDDQHMEGLVARSFLSIRSVFHSFRLPVQRYDFFRYLVVYRLGGFYFDLDVFLANGVEGLLSSSCVFPFEALTINGFLRKTYAMDWEVGTYAFGAVAGHPFSERS